jgi:outer membrane protein OmpA-like peptidoglycan-associated protein
MLIGVLLNYSVFCDINLSLQGEIQTSPWFYEPVYKMEGISFSTSWMMAITIQRFTAGLGIFSDYVSLNGKKEESLLKGAWFNLGCNAAALYEVSSWLLFSLHAGLFWNQSSFDFNNSGWLGRSLPGIELMFSTLISLTGNIDLEIINRFDLLLSQNELMEDIYYKLGARVHIDPGLRFFKVYLELDASYWDYKSDIMTDGVSSWVFLGQAGVFFRWGKKPAESIAETDRTDGDIIGQDEKTDPVVTFPDQAEDVEKQEKETDHVETVPDQHEITENREEDKIIPYTDPDLEALKNAEPGDSILFYSILFLNEDITEESLPVLNGMADILMKKESLVISIHGYSEFMQDPLKELELCKIRAKKIKDYLVSRGVKETQIRQHPVGNIIMDKRYYTRIEVIKNK